MTDQSAAESPAAAAHHQEQQHQHHNHHQQQQPHAPCDNDLNLRAHGGSASGGNQQLVFAPLATADMATAEGTAGATNAAATAATAATSTSSTSGASSSSSDSHGSPKAHGEEEHEAATTPAAAAVSAAAGIVNLQALLPKKTKHGRIGGSLYRALKDAGVDVSALKIPRGRPPRHKVGQKRPKRPTLLDLIRSGAELPMIPGAQPRAASPPASERNNRSPNATGMAVTTAAATVAATTTREAEAGFMSPEAGPASGKEGFIAAPPGARGLRDMANKPRARRVGGDGPRRSKRASSSSGVTVGMGMVDEDGEPMTADDAATGLLLLGDWASGARD